MKAKEKSFCAQKAFERRKLLFKKEKKLLDEWSTSRSSCNASQKEKKIFIFSE